MRLTSFTVATIVAAAALTSHAQVFRARAEGVRVSVLATDGGRPIAGLRAADFELRDNGVVQRIDVAPAGGPIGVTLVLDLSGSVRGRPLQNLTAAADAMLTSLQDGDRAGLVTFAAPVDLLALPTTDIASVRTQLRDLHPAGSTSLFDAAAAALVVAEREVEPTLILLFSDGDDNSSWLSAASIATSAARAEAVVYAVAVRTLRQFARPETAGFLDRLTSATGGSVEHAGSTENISRTFLRIIGEFRQRYVLTYVPAGTPRPGWHDLDIRLKGHRGRITARRGYWVGQGVSPAGFPQP